MDQASTPSKWVSHGPHQHCRAILHPLQLSHTLAVPHALHCVSRCAMTAPHLGHRQHRPCRRRGLQPHGTRRIHLALPRGHGLLHHPHRGPPASTRVCVQRPHRHCTAWLLRRSRCGPAAQLRLPRAQQARSGWHDRAGDNVLLSSGM